MSQSGDFCDFLGSDGEELRVVKGSNNLDTCQQYKVKNAAGWAIMNVKYYDKHADLFAREGSHNVGSRCKQILGS